MALKHAVLAALTSQEGSGYELSKRFDQSVANFWPASAQQIYRELDRLESEGLVRARTVHQVKRPDKRVFKVTASGREELGDFVRGRTRPTVIRDDLLVKIASLNEANSADVSVAVHSRMEASREKLKMYESLRASLLGGRPERDFLATSPRDGNLGVYLALKRGIAFERENSRWAREVLQILG